MLRKIIKYCTYVILISLALLFLVFSILFINGGALREIQNVTPPECKRIESPQGSIEDLQIDKTNNTVILSVLDRRAKVQGEKVTGTISALDLTKHSLTNSVILNGPQDFQPHGLSLFNHVDGTKTLHVINHSEQNGELIEVFRKLPTQRNFFHLKTLSSPLLISPNDIIAIGPQSFYVANDSGATSIIERIAELIFSDGISPLLYFNGNNFVIAKDDLRSSSGINFISERNLLVVGETAGRTIRLYQLTSDGTIESEVMRLPIDGAVDNIDADADGNLWIANHIDTWSLTKSFLNKSFKSPTQIQKIVLNDDFSYKINTIYENNGKQISAGSIGAMHNNIVLIGSITEKQILACNLVSRAIEEIY